LADIKADILASEEKTFEAEKQYSNHKETGINYINT